MSTVTAGRQRVLGGMLVGLALLTILALFEVLATVFFAITVAYILAPARRRLRGYGVGATPATILITFGAAIVTIAIVAPIAILLFYRLEEALLLLSEVPESLDIEIGDRTFEFVIEDGLNLAESWLQDTAITVSSVLPVLLVKFALFVFVVFGLLHNERDIGESFFTVVPPRYRDIVEILHQRARDTLFALYVLQGATAFGTVVVAIPFFYAFGYEAWFALATIAGIMQFVPVIGPSLLIVLLAAGELVLGTVAKAALVLVLGGIIIAALPDLVIRPYLASWTTELSSVLYFIGFVGGLLSLGAIGVIVGPLLIALLVEVAELVAAGYGTGGGHIDHRDE